MSYGYKYLPRSRASEGVRSRIMSRRRSSKRMPHQPIHRSLRLIISHADVCVAIHKGGADKEIPSRLAGQQDSPQPGLLRARELQWHCRRAARLWAEALPSQRAETAATIRCQLPAGRKYKLRCQCRRWNGADRHRDSSDEQHTWRIRAA